MSQRYETVNRSRLRSARVISAGSNEDWSDIQTTLILRHSCGERNNARASIKDGTSPGQAGKWLGRDVEHWHTDSWRVIGIQHVSLMQQKQRCWTHGLTAPPVSRCRTPQPHHKLGQAFTQGSLEEIQSHARYKKTTKSYFLQTMLFLNDLIWGFTSTAALHQVKAEREPVSTASHTWQEVNFQLLTKCYHKLMAQMFLSVSQ